MAEKPPPPPRWGKHFWHQIYPFQAISSNFGFGGRKDHPDEGKNFDTRSIHFRQFWATLVLVAEKTPPPPDEGKFLTPDLSISANFKQLWFWWQKKPPTPDEGKFLDTRYIHFRKFQATLVLVAENLPSPDEGKIFDTRSIHFRQFQATLVLVAEKPPTPHEGKFLDTRSIHFRQFWATLVLVAENLPSPDEGKIFDTRSIHFRQFWATLVLVAEKPPPTPRWGKIFWHQIYPFQAILSNFGFGGRKAPPPTPQMRGKFFWHQIYPFQAILSNFGFGGRKAPSPSQMREKFLTPDISISGNFKQLWFWWQKSPSTSRWGKNFWHQIYPFQAILSNFGFGGRKDHPCRWGENFLTPDLSISGNFKQLWFWWQKSPHPTWGKNFWTPDLSISGNFEQLWFLWQKSLPLPRWGKNFWHQIYPFQAILSNFGFGGRKDPPRWGKIFWHQIYPFQGISSNFGFGGRKAPPPTPQMRGKFFDTRSIHFRQFWATLVLVAEKPPPPPSMREKFLTPDISISGNFKQLWFWWQKRSPRWGKKFWHQIYPFQAISSNFGFGGRKDPPRWGEIFDTRSIHFRQFKQLWFGGRKPPPHMRENFWTPDLSISGNFEQLWFWRQKRPLLPRLGKNFWHQIYPFQAILSNFGFGGRKDPPNEGKIFDTRSIHFRQFRATLVLVEEKTPPMREKILTPDLSISGNFKQLWFWWQKSPPNEGKFFYTGSIHFRQFWATLVFVAEKPPSLLCLFMRDINSCYPCGIPMVPILQICTQIPPIWISSLGY